MAFLEDAAPASDAAGKAVAPRMHANRNAVSLMTSPTTNIRRPYNTTELINFL